MIATYSDAGMETPMPAFEAGLAERRVSAACGTKSRSSVCASGAPAGEGGAPAQASVRTGGPA